MSITAMKQAFEALEEINKLSIGEGAICLPAEIDDAMDALRQAIEQAEKQKPVNIKKVAEEHGINLPTEFVPKHDESKAAIQSLTDQCAALIWERDELQKQVWRYEKQEPVAFASHGVVNWIADKQFQHEADLYTTPQPQRQWVGLTESEKRAAIWSNGSYGSGALWADDILKEKITRKIGSKNCAPILPTGRLN